MPFIPVHEQDPFFFNYQDTKDLGKDLAEEYSAGNPFPHIVIDDFFPQAVVDYCLQHFPTKLGPEGTAFDRDQERFKKSYQPDHLEPRLRALFYSLNSRPFIKIIENITGIKALIPDPYFLGGGFHEIATGGHLSMHTDFNHHRQMNLERRVNVLVYLNPSWKEEYGGQLEFWTSDMKQQVKSIVPIINRCAIFTTTENSMHGNPQPVGHPEGVSRKSIALYYYTSTWDLARPDRTTHFQARPGTKDRFDWDLRTREFLEEFLPPAVFRKVLPITKRILR